MRKQPKYLLFCPDLEGMNTILYVINNEVFIYRIVEMEKYKLDYYMKQNGYYGFMMANCKPSTHFGAYRKIG